MPVVNSLKMTLMALIDCLEQSIETRVLVVLQGADPEIRTELERWAENEPRLLVWSHYPPLPSLSATWNLALDFVWECGGEHALVVNNDVRLHRQTYERLISCMKATQALFCTAVGVTESQFEIFCKEYPELYPEMLSDTEQHGGPDFSCFLISKACHRAGRFDEGFQPAYCEDLDYHRRLMLGGHAEKIFSINLPFLHFASGTRKEMTDEQREALDQRLQRSRAHYEKKWGGPVNGETYYAPLGGLTHDPKGVSKLDWEKRCGPTTPELQAYFQQKAAPDVP